MKAILIVEDEASFRDMLRMASEARGFIALSAESPGDALAIAATRELDAVITDVHMPRTDGLALCRELRKQSEALDRQLPVWVMTGSFDLTPDDVLAVGARGVFRKPFHVREIIEKIEHHLQQQGRNTDGHS